MIVMIIILLAIYTYLAWYKLDYGVYAVLCLLPTYLIRFQVAQIPFTMLEGMILILFVVWLIHLYRENSKYVKSYRSYFLVLFSYLSGYYHKKSEKILKKVRLVTLKYDKIRPLILLFIGAGVLSLFVAPDWRAAAGIFKAYILEPILFFIVTISIINSKHRLQKIFYSLGILSLVVSSYAIIQYITGTGLLIESYQGITLGRSTSFFEYPNAVGLLVAPILGLMTPLFFHEFLNTPKNSKKIIFYASVVVLGVIAIIFARSESALLAYCAVLFLYMLLAHKVTRLISIGGVAIILGIFFMYPSIVHKVSNKVLLHDFSGEIRRHIYKESFQMLTWHPIFGAGLSGYQEAMMQFHQDVIWIGKTLQPVEIFMYPHNFILNFWTEMGLLGLFMFGYLCLYSMYSSLKNRERLYAQVMMFSLSVLLIHGLVDVPFFKNDLAVLFWTIISILIISQSLEKKWG